MANASGPLLSNARDVWLNHWNCLVPRSGIEPLLTDFQSAVQYRIFNMVSENTRLAQSPRSAAFRPAGLAEMMCTPVTADEAEMAKAAG
jgi:hypothetical protein